MNIRTAALRAGLAGALAGAYTFGYRPWFLRWGSTCDERRARWPGDDLVEHPRVTSMRAITIDAPPEKVWAWIQQIGQDRGGFYSYRVLENLAGAQMPMIEQIVPEFAPRTLGEEIWLSVPSSYGGKAKLAVAAIEKDRSMILVSMEDYERIKNGEPIRGGTWGFILQPLPDEKTRLVMRSVAARPMPSFWELPHFIMERRMMTRIKELAER